MGLTNDINIFPPPVLQVQVPKSAVIMFLPDHKTTQLTNLQVEALYVPVSRVTHNDDTRGHYRRSKHIDADDLLKHQYMAPSHVTQLVSVETFFCATENQSRNSLHVHFMLSSDDDHLEVENLPELVHVSSPDDDSESSDDDSKSADDDFKYNNDDSECASTSALYYMIKYLFKR